MKTDAKMSLPEKMARAVVSAVFPPTCACCKCLLSDPDTDGTCFCKTCMSDFAASVRGTCKLCGKAVSACECVPDVLAGSGVDRTYASFLYDKDNRKCAASSLIYKLKDGKNSDVTRFCAHIFALRIEKAAFSSGLELSEYTVTYAPRRRIAIRENGSDHMEKTARLTAKMLGIGFESVFVNTATAPQKKKDAVSRFEDAKRFIKMKERMKKRISGKRYVVLDDVLTSGATLAACVSKLRENGADDVIAVTLAKAK